MTLYYQEKVGIIYCGDCLEVLKSMESESVDMIITSPPYYGLRNYGDVDGQFGLENSFNEFLDKMLEIIGELKRVLKSTGSFWLNFGDCYASQPAGNKSISEANEGKDGYYRRIMQRNEGAKTLHRFGGNSATGKINENLKEKQGRARMGNDNYQEKCMLMMPERVALKMIDNQGWILRNKICWSKQVYLKKENKTIGGVMPTSVKDRFNQSWEYLYFFVKNKKYYSNLDAVRIPIFESNLERPRIGQNQFQSFNYRVRDAERKVGQPQFKATEKEIELYGKNRAGGLVRDRELGYNSKYRNYKYTKNQDPRGDNQGGAGSFRLVLDEEKRNKQRKIDITAKHFQLKGQGGNISLPYKGQNLKGKNLPTTWLVGTEPHRFDREFNMDIDHFAAYPQALCEIPILFGCPENGIVLDLFNGSGTTCIVAKKLKRQFIGIDLNEKYCELAKKRLQAVPPSLF